MKSRSILSRLLALTISILIALLLAEGLMRLYYLIRDPQIAYEENRGKFRDIDHEKAKPAGTLRIAFVGDSFTYGQGVRFESIFPVLTGKLLAEKIRDKKIETLNFGKQALNIWGYEDLVQHRVLAYDPDVIVLGFVLNDFASNDAVNYFLHLFRKERRRYGPFFTLEKASKLATFIDTQIFHLFSNARHLHITWLNDQFIPERNPDYAEMIKSTEKTLSLMAGDGRRGIVLFFPYFVGDDEENLSFYSRAKGIISGLCEKSGCRFIEVLPHLKSKPYYRWWVNREDHHPNREAHAIISRALADAIAADLSRD